MGAAACKRGVREGGEEWRRARFARGEVGRERGRFLPRKVKRRERREREGGDEAGGGRDRGERACSEATGESLEWDARGTGEIKWENEEGSSERGCSWRARWVEEDPAGKEAKACRGEGRWCDGWGREETCEGKG